jgi:hypothetical protein
MSSPSASPSAVPSTASSSAASSTSSTPPPPPKANSFFFSYAHDPGPKHSAPSRLPLPPLPRSHSDVVFAILERLTHDGVPC